MTEFWESSFIEKQTMWGFEPADAAIVTKDLFLEKGIKDILIPGIGYGRNAKVFLDHGIAVTGIEISQTAIELARTHYGNSIPIYHGSVTDMPFDHKLYDGIFCFALIHLLSLRERRQLIKDCYQQLQPGGYMTFSVISKKAPTFGQGQPISKDRFKTMHGVNLFFYDETSIKQEFGKYGLTTITVIDEPVKNLKDKAPIPFWLITCRKEG